AGGVARLDDIPGELLNAKLSADAQAIDTDDDALSSEALAQCVDELRVRQRGRIHGDLFRAGAEHGLGIRHRADSAGDAKRDVEQPCDARHPRAIDDAPAWTRGDVVKDELIGPLVAIARRELEDISDDAM